MKRRDFLIIYAAIWVVTIGLILFRVGMGHQTAFTTAADRGIAVMWFMILYSPPFLVLYMMTVFLIDGRDKILNPLHFKVFLHKRRMSISLFVLAMVAFVVLNFI